MDTLVRDVTQALRLLASHRGFAAAALITIALGVGGTSAVFSVVYGVLLRPLPYAEPERLVRLSEVHPGANAPITTPLLSHPTYHAWSRALRDRKVQGDAADPGGEGANRRDAANRTVRSLDAGTLDAGTLDAGALDAIGAFRVSDYTVTGGGAGQRLRGTRVTPSVFRLLRASPAAGRFFTDADAEPGAEPVVVLSHALWRERFGGDASVLGTTLLLDDAAHRIVGVAPPGFAFPARAEGWSDAQRGIALYTPLAVPAVDPAASVIGIVTTIARLAPGATIAQAEGEGTSIARSVDRPFADLVFGKGGRVEVRVRSLVDQMTMRVRPALMVLMAGVGLVLLIACANVANLLLSRGADRTRELAVRAALGAGRRRLVRQLVTESLVLSLIGGALGALVGWALTAAVPALAPAGFPRVEDIRVDAWFLAAAALTAILVGIVSGVVPATRSARVDLSAAMIAGGARSVGASGAHLRRMLLIAEAALAVVLLVGAALLARSFVALLHVDAGYEPAHVLTAELHLTGTRAVDTATWTSPLVASTLERLRAVPGVRAAGAGSMAPFGGVLSSIGFALPGMTTRDGQPLIARALLVIVTPGYAEALGLRLKEGRFVRAADSTSPIISMLVNETFARTYFTDGRPATGRRFTGIFPRLLKRNDAVVEIVGVVRDALPAGLDALAQPQVYVAPAKGFELRSGTLVIQTDGDPAAVAPLLHGIVQQTDARAALDRVGPLTDKIAASVSEPRFAASVLAAFALLALTLATTGLYGVLSYNVAQRRREIGVRAALGATRGDLIVMVLREGLGVTAIGLAVGVVAAALASRAMTSLLFGVTARDLVAFSVAPLLLLIVASAACLIPARRAARIDPAVALRTD